MGNLNVSKDTLGKLHQLAIEDDRSMSNMVQRLTNEETRFRQSDEYINFKKIRDKDRVWVLNRPKYMTV